MLTIARKAAKRRRYQKTDLDRLNDLIDWYNQFKPQAGQVIKVKMSEDYLKLFAKPLRDRPNFWEYRNRLLERMPT